MRSTCRVCSIRSSPRGAAAAPGWGSPSRARSSRCTAARSRSTTAPRAEYASACSCRWGMAMAKARILVVDDEEPLTRILKLHLEHTERYEVRVENHGARALAAAREFRPDLVLLDVLMPDRTGQEIWEELRADPELRDVAVLFLTATVRESGSRDEPGSGRVA